MRPLLLCCALAICLPAWPQTTPGASFSGTVVALTRVTDPSLPRVRVLVRVAQPAYAAGQLLAFEEWEGLWLRSDRYRLGQNITVALYPASALGLTSARSPSPATRASQPRQPRFPRDRRGSPRRQRQPRWE